MEHINCYKCLMDEITSISPDAATNTAESVLSPITGNNNLETTGLNVSCVSQSQLSELTATKDLKALHSLGGLTGLAASLRTDLTTGLKDGGGDTVKIDPGFTARKKEYGENRLPPRKRKTFWRFAWMAFNDKMMILLTVLATVDLALGIYQSISAALEEPDVQWVEGVSIIVAVVVIVLATAINDFQMDCKFRLLNQKNDERDVIVIRSGRAQQISIHEIVVGDLVHLETGDVIPVDGILIHGFSVQCDESSSTGESDFIEKIPALKGNIDDSVIYDPFMLSGSKVSNGVGTFLVISVGENSSYGKILMSLHNEIEETPLQQKLGALAKYIVRVGLIVGGVFFLIIFIRYLVHLRGIKGGPREKGKSFLNVFILAITVVVIAVPEGLPLAVTMSLAYATARMLKDNNLVRLLKSCEVMGNATTICSDKTGTLTQNKMTVVAGRVATYAPFTDENTTSRTEIKTDVMSLRSAMASLSGLTRDLIKDSVILNSTALEKANGQAVQLVGTSTEVALIEFAQSNLHADSVIAERKRAEIVELFPFNANRKCMAVAVRISSGAYRVYLKGAPETILQKCSCILTDSHTGLFSCNLQDEMRNTMGDDLRGFSSQSLRSIALAYRDFDYWPLQKPVGTECNDLLDEALQDMVLIGMFALRDPLRPEVTQSVHDCQSAGVSVRMVTGDTFLTAKAIALECGIYQPGGIAMDSSIFRKLSSSQLDMVLPRLQILSRSSPEDKLRLVSHLRRLRETVAVTGDGTNDALALKEADVGFAMGIQGTEVAKEASSIILMDDNFASIVKAILWGRTVNDAAEKFLQVFHTPSYVNEKQPLIIQQFQFTINITAGILTIVSALSGGTSASVFTVVQLLWINLIMDTFAALALATDRPTRRLLKRTPEPRGSPIVKITMWKMIAGQSIYQLAVIFVLYYAGERLFHCSTKTEKHQIQTMTFNIYVWMQFFNMLKSALPPLFFIRTLVN